MLVADIDRGGAFAHLYGTWALLNDQERARIRWFVLNKFRGDASLLAPAPARLQELTVMCRSWGVLPWLAHGLPGRGRRRRTTGPHYGRRRSRDPATQPPRTSMSSSRLRSLVAALGASALRDLDRADLVVLPGSKHVAARP